ncbi:hypothetical protein CUMW_011990 [Citrus unshiu]|nr:hypothetical protein CUMW_011990 [Citrus unshiu]
MKPAALRWRRLSSAGINTSVSSSMRPMLVRRPQLPLSKAFASDAMMAITMPNARNTILISCCYAVPILIYYYL